MLPSYAVHILPRRCVNPGRTEKSLSSLLHIADVWNWRAAITLVKVCMHCQTQLRLPSQRRRLSQCPQRRPLNMLVRCAHSLFVGPSGFSSDHFRFHLPSLFDVVVHHKVTECIISREPFNLESPNLTLTLILISTTATSDMTSSVTSGRLHIGRRLAISAKIMSLARMWSCLTKVATLTYISLANCSPFLLFNR